MSTVMNAPIVVLFLLSVTLTFCKPLTPVEEIELEAAETEREAQRERDLIPLIRQMEKVKEMILDMEEVRMNHSVHVVLQ